jgi:hypothetical protein
MNESDNSPGLNPDQQTTLYAPGMRIRVTQQIAQRASTYVAVLEGTVLRQERQGSGSWYAGNPGDKVWLDRLVLQKADGEISILNLDEYTRVEVLAGGTGEAKPGTAPLVLTNADRYGGIS